MRPCSPYGSKDHSLRTSDEGGSKGQLYSWWHLLYKQTFSEHRFRTLSVFSITTVILNIHMQSTSHLLVAWTKPIYLIQCTLSWCETNGSWHALSSPLGQKTGTHMTPTNKHTHLQNTHHVFGVSKCVHLFYMSVYFLYGSAVPMMSCYCTYNKCAALFSAICILSRYLTRMLSLQPTRQHILNYEYYCLVWLAVM